MADINVDNHKLMYHPERVAEWKEKGDCFPIYVEIGPTNRCNHKCIFCALDWIKHGSQDIDKEVMLSTLEDMASHGVKSVMFAGEGEPFLHKDTPLFVKKAKQSGMDVSITTNGVLFTKGKIEQCLPYLSWIRFSVDSGSPENYSKIHGTRKEDFEKLIGNIRDAAEFKRRNHLQATIGAQFLMIPQNASEAEKLARILKDAGADNLQLKPYSHHPLSKNDFVLEPRNYNQLEEKLMKYNSDDFRVLFRRATIERIESGIPYDVCYGLPFFSLIDSKGNVLPCNLFYDNPEFTYGNLYEKSFSEIWTGEKRKEILKKIHTEECRKGCRLDVMNRYLERLKNPQPHDNFP